MTDSTPPTQRPGIVFLKRSLLAVWAVWLTVVFVTNVLDAVKALGWLGEDWMFASGNFAFLTATTARYGTPPWLNAVLFGGVILWEGTASALFWLAFATFRGRGGKRSVFFSAAFTASLLLWAAFAIADEIFIKYDVEASHLRLFIAQLVMLLAIELLPEGPAAS